MTEAAQSSCSAAVLRDLALQWLYMLQVIEAGANALVAGSAVFGAPDYKEGKTLA